MRPASLRRLAVLALCGLAPAIYVPGYSVRSYADNEPIPLLATRLFSERAGTEHPYHDQPVGCPPPSAGDSTTPVTDHGGLAPRQPTALTTRSTLPLPHLARLLFRADDAPPTPVLALPMGHDIPCAALCTRRLSRREVLRARQLVAHDVAAEMLLDGLPAATPLLSVDRRRKLLRAGWRLGAADPTARDPSGRDRVTLNNHLSFIVRWRAAPGRAGARGEKAVVAVEVYPRSLEAGHRRGGPGSGDDVEGVGGCPLPDALAHMQPLELDLPGNLTEEARLAQLDGASFIPRNDNIDDGATLAVPYTYSVYFREDDTIDWAARWDDYFRVDVPDLGRAATIVQSLVLTIALWAAVLAVWLWAGRRHARVAGAWPARSASPTKLSMSLEEGVARKQPDAIVSQCPSSSSSSASASSSSSSTSSSAGSTSKSPSSPPRPTRPSRFHAIRAALRCLSQGVRSCLRYFNTACAGWHALALAAAAADDTSALSHPPPRLGLLCPVVGSGVQGLLTWAALDALSILGIVQSRHRLAFAHVAAGLYLAAGLGAGFASSRLYRTWDGLRWRRNSLATALLVPCLVFVWCALLDLYVWVRASSTAVPLPTLAAQVALWAVIQVPIVHVGSYVGYHRRTSPSPSPAASDAAHAAPTRTRASHRPHTPTRSMLPVLLPTLRRRSVRLALTILLSGALPFCIARAAASAMLRTTLVDKTGHYDLYAYTSGLAFLVLLSTAGVTVLSALIFLLLRDYAANVDPSPSSPSTSPSPTPADLWWHSLVTGASSACWTASYCLWCHGVRALQSQGLAAALLLLGSSLAATALYALLVATAGFLAAYVLVRRLSRIHG